MKLNYYLRLKNSGFTLIEVLAVMIVLVALATITVKSTTQFSFDNRYQMTADRYDKIKTAILGNPNQTINGHPSVSGFVADMGRLPNNLRELLEKPTDANDWAIYGLCTSATPPTVEPKTQTDCDAISGSWVSLGIGAGWRGAYISTTNNPKNSNAFADGWGNLGGANNPNYGWDFDNSTLDNLIIKSYGKDGILDSTMPLPNVTTGLCSNSSDVINLSGTCNPTLYDNDYPQNNAAMINSNEWQTPSTAIISFNPPSSTPTATIKLDDATHISAITINANSITSLPATITINGTSVVISSIKINGISVTSLPAIISGSTIAIEAPTLPCLTVYHATDTGIQQSDNAPTVSVPTTFSADVTIPITTFTNSLPSLSAGQIAYSLNTYDSNGNCTIATKSPKIFTIIPANAAGELSSLTW